MSVATREATIACEGALARGSGTPSSGSGALEQLPIRWAEARRERGAAIVVSDLSDLLEAP